MTQLDHRRDRYFVTLPVGELRSTPRYWTGHDWTDDPRRAQVYTADDAETARQACKAAPAKPLPTPSPG